MDDFHLEPPERLVDDHETQVEIAEFRKVLGEIGLPAKLVAATERELQRLQQLPATSPGYHMTRSFLQLVTELPWGTLTQDNLDLQHARQRLNEDHHGLEKIKERLLEHLAVCKLNPDAPAPVLCLVGPPGVGKTSLGRSLASVLGRPFQRILLAGVSAETELRGQRRTFSGAAPGRLLLAVRRAAVRNPLIMLSDIDKLERDFHGNPAAALLEVLDPAQNSAFCDDYLEMPFDMSRVLFMATANTLESVPRTLSNCMEVVEISGYSEFEKLHIARKHLVPRRLQGTGLAGLPLAWTDEALRGMIRHHTCETGVRQLDHMITRVCRKIATRVAADKDVPAELRAADLRFMLGPERFSRGGPVRNESQPGVAVGLAGTPLGGTVLSVEAVALPDNQELIVTGQSDVRMQELVATAQSFIRSQWAELNIDKQALTGGIHLHVPAGATSNEGPSVGLAIATALASLYTFLPARGDTALAGIMSLTGTVWPVSGVTEKILASHRAGIRRVILPAGNQRDLGDVPKNVRNEMEFLWVDHVLSALSGAIPQLESRLEHSLPAI